MTFVSPLCRRPLFRVVSFSEEANAVGALEATDEGHYHWRQKRVVCPESALDEIVLPNKLKHDLMGM